MSPLDSTVRRVFANMLACATALALVACGATTWNPGLYTLDGGLPVDAGDDRWLKVHMLSGDLYVLESWQVPSEGEALRGRGTLYDVTRSAGEARAFEIPLDSIALLETSDRDVVGEFAITGLGVFTTLTGAATFACLADPKSCFGSCPTFYADEESDRPLAEGFSASFARVLEASDIDRLGLSDDGGAFSLVMRNEAQETHAVRHVRLLAAPLGGAESVLLSTGGELLRAERSMSPDACRAEQGSCLREVGRRDDVEYAPTADEHDLARRETLHLDFGRTSGELGLVLSARHSFVTTYVFYQSLAWAGGQAGELLAALERGEPGLQDRVLGVARELGGIEVRVREAGGAWRSAGVYDEAGPIAADQQVVELGHFDDAEVEVELSMAQGSWRIDEVALTHLLGPTEAVTLEPDSVTPLSGTARDERGRLKDPDDYLVTVQGDAHRLWFTIPHGAGYHLFLESRGYYYEWMRAGWLAEQDPVMASVLLARPDEALRMLAPGFKAVEPQMERLFWASRFRR